VTWSNSGATSTWTDRWPMCRSKPGSRTPLSETTFCSGSRSGKTNTTGLLATAPWQLTWLSWPGATESK